MALPSYRVLSGTQFRVGFGPRGTFQRLVLTDVHADRLAKCDGKIVAEHEPTRDRVAVLKADAGSRHKKIFRIPWELKGKEDVERATREVLLRSHGNFANRVVFQPLGLNDDDERSPDQSANAMLGAIYALWSGAENTVPHQILISINASSMVYEAFEIALEKHFFPYRQAENPNSGLPWKSTIGRSWARNFGRSGQNLFDYLKALSDKLERNDAAQNIYQVARERPEIFKAEDIDRMSAYVYESCKGIRATLFTLRMLGGRVGEAARMALVKYESDAAAAVVGDEKELIAQADEAELAEAVPIERARFFETLSPDSAAVDVNAMCSGEDSIGIRCNYDALWKRIGAISWKDDSGQVHRQFIRFHNAEPVTRSRMRNHLFSMGMRVANRKEAEKILQMLKIAVLERYGRKANPGSHLLDGTQEWFLNLCAEYRNHPTAFDSDSHVASFPEYIGKGTLYLHFQNHAEADRDSYRFLRILAEDFGLTFVSPREA